MEVVDFFVNHPDIRLESGELGPGTWDLRGYRTGRADRASMLLGLPAASSLRRQHLSCPWSIVALVWRDSDGA